MNQWEYEEYDTLEYRGKNQQTILYYIWQQNIQSAEVINHQIIIPFQRNQAIRLSQLILLNHKSIVLISPVMRLKIIELCTKQLLFLKDNQLVSAPILYNKIWFINERSIFVNQIRNDVIITDGQIRSFILELWSELFFENKWQSNENPIKIAQNQLRKGFDLNSISYQFELLRLSISVEEINFVIHNKIQENFPILIRLIKNQRFEFPHRHSQSLTQFRSLILNELINEHSTFVRNFSQKDANDNQFYQVLFETLKLGAIYCFFQKKGADFALKEHFQNLQELSDYCLRNSLFEPLNSIDQSQRLAVIHKVEQGTMNSIISQWYYEKKSAEIQNEAILRYCQAFEGNLKNKILIRLQNSPLTVQFKELLVVSTISQEEIKILIKQFCKLLKGLNQAELINFEVMMNNYIERNNNVLEMALSKSKQFALEAVISQLIQND